MSSDILNVDLASQPYMHNPFPTLARLREAGPVVRLELPFVGKSWVATTHEAASEVLKDEQTFVRNAKNAGRRGIAGFRWWMPRTFRVLAESMIENDGAEHRRLRKLVDQAFNRQSVESMRGRIGSICDDLLDRLPADRPVDLLESLARSVPLAVICELLGLPEEDRPRFRQWVRPLGSVTSLLGIVRCLWGIFRLMGYFKGHFEQCRQEPRPGLMTALVQAEQDGDKLSENELLAMAILLLIAGHETTVHLISGGVLALLEAPEQKARLLVDWSLVPLAVEELLRVVCVAQMAKPRHASRDLEFHGQTLLRGEMITPMLASANTDPARFNDPERLDITRSPNPHLAFGSGAHFCLGAQLARVEAQVVMERLFTRFPKLSLAGSASALKYTGVPAMRALRALPVRLT